ncbi:MAG: peptidoglycan DD-metalloendopeptidase family protein [Bdellovibrionales bacterium]|nr:peptidoglycan DD-metalloendopeptidase family protein [Bdellovibrionales bacterium]
MLQYNSPRTRTFRKRRLGLRKFVLPLIAIAAVYGTLSLLSAPDAVPHDNAPQLAAADVLTPAPNAAHFSGVDNIPGNVPGNMKAAFNHVPAAASYEYRDLANAEQRPFDKPQTPPQISAEDVPPAIAEKLAQINSRIQSFLQSGSNLFVAEKTLEVGRGDTLMELLVRNDVPRSEAYSAIQALRKVYNPRDLNPGNAITVFFHKDPAVADPKFSGLQIQKDKISSVMVNLAEDGSYKVDQHEKPIFRSMKAARGTIENSLYVSAKNSGVPDAIILDLIKMYSWNVDFQRDIQIGDKFEVMYEEFATDNGDVVAGRNNIVYAKLELGGRDLPFYLYTSPSGDTDYFDGKGQSAKKSLMRTPIDGARLSSGFGMRRHPILGYGKMHKGIDFAAPRGTPIYAAGDGTIDKLGFVNGYGNYIRIRHRKDLQTAYAHMHGFRAGLKNGSRIKQGQIIGYVGTTGRSTGPHLHYEVLINGKHVNPSSIKAPTGKMLEGQERKRFNTLVSERDGQFDKLMNGMVIADSTPVKPTKQASR